MIRSFPQQGMSVIVSSHTLSEVSILADRIGIIADGRLAYENELHAGEDLEGLFMDVLRRS